MKKFLILVVLAICLVIFARLAVQPYLKEINDNDGYAKIIIDNEWARLTPNGMGAVFFEIKNTNTKDDFLIKASSPNALSEAKYFGLLIVLILLFIASCFKLGSSVER